MEKDKIFGLPVHIDEDMPVGLVAITNWKGETVGIMEKRLLTIDEIRKLYPGFKDFRAPNQTK